MGISLKKKISVKTVVGNVLKTLPTDENGVVNGAKVNLMRVAGVVNGVRTGQSTFGEWTAYKGEFRAINLVTSEEFAGSELFVPDIVDSLLKPVAREAEKNGGAIQVAFDIGVISQVTDTDVGYEYTAVPLLEMSAEKSPAAALLESLGDLPKALPAPTTGNVPAAESAKKPAKGNK